MEVICDWKTNPDRKPHEECGVFGVYFNETQRDIGSVVALGLSALQHRGQEACGVAVNDGGLFSTRKDLGLVSNVLDRESLEKLGGGKIAVGHVRYSTTGSTNPRNTQPTVVRHSKGHLAISHNGNIVNAGDLRARYENSGGIFHSTNDSEVICYAIVEKRLNAGKIEEALAQAMEMLEGSFSLAVASPSKLMAARDRHGMRPLCLGEFFDDNNCVCGYAVASETCALDAVGAKFMRDILPGEVLTIGKDGLKSDERHCGSESRLCVFEYVYFSRPDSVVDGVSVHEARIRAGEFLAVDSPVEADLVIGVPSSGIDAAIGYARKSGLPYEIGLIKNNYVGRSFIQPTQQGREATVRMKLNPISSVLSGKRVVMIDDSIVRGTTQRNLVKLLRSAGAKEVHVRISSPPFVEACHFGTDIDNRDNLAACRMSIAELCAYIGADSLKYLSVERVNMIANIGDVKRAYCDGCFTGNYPYSVPENASKDKFERRIGEN